MITYWFPLLSILVKLLKGLFYVHQLQHSY